MCKDTLLRKDQGAQKRQWWYHLAENVNNTEIPYNIQNKYQNKHFTLGLNIATTFSLFIVLSHLHISMFEFLTSEKQQW